MEKYNEVTSAIMFAKLKDFLHDSFGHFTANAMDSEEFCNGIEKIWGYEISEFTRETINNTLSYHATKWENYPIDNEGATPLQQYHLDEIEYECVDYVMFALFGNLND